MKKVKADKILCAVREAVTDIFVDDGANNNGQSLSEYQVDKLNYIYDAVGEVIADIRGSEALFKRGL